MPFRALLCTPREPDCAVRAAVEAGEISRERQERYMAAPRRNEDTMEGSLWLRSRRRLLAADFLRHWRRRFERMARRRRGLAALRRDGRLHSCPTSPSAPGILQGGPARSSLPVDAHLMIERPEALGRRISPQAGAKIITVHAEAGGPSAPRARTQIRERGCLAGVALNPGHVAGVPALSAGRASTWRW